MVTNPMGSSSLLQCPMDFMTTYDTDVLLPVMQALESQF